MKIRNIIISCLILTFGVMTSCDSFLDTMPDQRAELGTSDKVKKLLVSAYPTLVPMLLYEMRTDNVADNGELYDMPGNLVARSYRYEDVGEDDWDTPQKVWDACYKAISAANQALDAIKTLKNSDDCLPYKGEALLCRAYGHFILANTFCMPYDAEGAEGYLGIPYIKSPETTVNATYVRGSLKEVYANINADIEEALPYITDEAYSVPLYHFNKRAAYAFASRFNLFYGNARKAADYATVALGEEPIKSLRVLLGYSQFTKPQEWTVAFLNKDQTCNMMLLVNRTLWGRTYGALSRYGHNKTIAMEETFWSKGPWKEDNIDGLSAYGTVFGSDQNVFVPKCMEMFEIIDQTAQTGQPHVTSFSFTTDETLITRAEAYVLLKMYDDAAEDLSDWYASKGASTRCTADEISNYYANAKTTTVSKPLNPKFTTLEPGIQTNMIQAVLHARRIETIHEGKRWLDIRRYGIEISHNLVNEVPVVLEPFDKRIAIQLPNAVTVAGLEKNPR